MLVVDRAFIRAKTIIECQTPEHHILKKLQSWLGKYSNSQRKFYSGVDADDFRMLGQSRGPIEIFVKDFAPERLTSLVRYVSVSTRR